LGARLWKGASVFFNPEMAGGEGLSGASGIAAAVNGETFRIGSPDPRVYVARVFFRQLFSLSDQTVMQTSEANQLAAAIPERYFAFTVGKIGVADYFDDNTYSHDPRTQFLSWALMDNGAWDYPANTRGYTPSIVLEYVTPKEEWRYDFSLMPKQANGSDMNWQWTKANSSSLEYTRRHKFGGRPGAVRVMGLFNTANMGNYRESILQQPIHPDITATRRYGNTKWGFCLNAEQELSDYFGVFFRASWNNGRNETWAFTEIDRALSGGVVANGSLWGRSDDHAGFAYAHSGLSRPHRDYLKAGGEGFMLGDGALRYGAEQLTELYYSAALIQHHLYCSGAWQCIVNPGYNKDRPGPVNVFSIRLHATM
jgi:high affinity Mn2+ porin